MWCLSDLTSSGKERALRLFQFSLGDQAFNWLEHLLAGSISTWEDFTTCFLAQLFPSGRTTKLLNDILMFQQHQVQIFYDHVNPATRRIVDQSAGGKLRDNNAKESWALLEDLALYDNESWNDPRDFAKLVKAISLPQDVQSTSDRHLIELENQVQCLMKAHLAPNLPVQVNKIASSLQSSLGKEDRNFSSPKRVHFVNTITTIIKEDEPKGIRILEPDATGEINHSTTIEKEEAIKKESKGSETVIKEGPKFIANAYINLDSPMNVMSVSYYNAIRNRGYEFRGQNFVGIGKDMHVSVGNMSHVIDFTILENIEANIDPSLFQVVFGRPFMEITKLILDREQGLITFTDGIKEVLFKTPYRDSKINDLTSEVHDLLSSRVILSEDDYSRGCERESDLESGFKLIWISLIHHIKRKLKGYISIRHLRLMEVGKTKEESRYICEEKPESSSDFCLDDSGMTI
ncbi:protein kinase-like domain, concanavalin A-like lectin/glucanase domain protein [Tanacetum coccineum]|uniref:Protein kinase-like domain, concanavalin A-like lectin/glucanase domain protein n=1 Tax=Tanacetum coccineum TaxID=301880 RepID=A0ABQ5EAA5_9ASTR